MSATYNEQSEADLDWVRSQLGDTDVIPEANALLSDERILAVLASWPDSRILALSQLAHELVAEFSQQPDTIRLASGLSVSFKPLLDSWKALAAPYRDWLAAQASAATPTTNTNHAWSGDVRTEVVW